MVNKQQSDAAEVNGIPFIAVSVGVSLSIAMPSIYSQIAGALVRNFAVSNPVLLHELT